jgi:hypothetical protein
MYTKETFFRPPEIGREARTLPAEVYNLCRILHHRCGDEALFVPIRSMFYLAVIDREEIVFLDGAVSRRQIVLAWRHFRPRERTGLDEPIPYEAVYHTADSPALMPRLHSEFPRALRQMREKEPFRTNAPADVVPLRRPR